MIQGLEWTKKGRQTHLSGVKSFPLECYTPYSTIDTETQEHFILNPLGAQHRVCPTYYAQSSMLLYYDKTGRFRQSRLFYTSARIWFNDHNRENSEHTSRIAHHPKGTGPTSTQKLNKEVCRNSRTNMPNDMQGHSFQREGAVNTHNETD